jgi:hypothetical protein
MPRVEVLAVEVRQYRVDDGDSGALVARLVGQTHPRRSSQGTAPWTVDEVLELVGEAGEDPAAVARIVRDWAKAHPYVRTTGGVGLSYPSFTASADSGRSASRFRGVLSLYGSPHGGRPMLEIRVKLMCMTPPIQPQGRSRPPDGGPTNPRHPPAGIRRRPQRQAAQHPSWTI